jgi:hypothetical protein
MFRARAALLLAVALCVAAPIGPSAAIASPAAPDGGAAPAWKQIYEDSQTIYYVGAASPAPTGPSDVATLLEFKVPQVVNGAQVWSVVSHMKLSCDERRMITIDNTLYALRMGAGPVVQLQAANDAWHQPQPGSFGDLVWSTACGKR